MAHILIAEDDAAMRFFLTSALTKAGHQVTAVNDGAEAWDKLQSATIFDMLLTDIVMPGIDGIELAQKARAMDADLKVMFITGFSAVSVGAPHDENNDNARLLSKPFHLNDLVQQVNQLLES